MGTADMAQPMGLNDQERFVGIREVMSLSETAQASTDFVNHKSQEWLIKIREGKGRFFQELRNQNNIPESLCVWCGEKPARAGYETCRECAEASEKASRSYANSYAIQSMASG